jgi:hypothetical protein
MTYASLRDTLTESKRENTKPMPEENVERLIASADNALKIGREILLNRNAEIEHIANSMSAIEKAILELAPADYEEAQSRLSIYDKILKMRDIIFQESIH